MIHRSLLLAFVLIVLVPEVSHSRCSEYAVSHLMEQRYQRCSSDIMRAVFGWGDDRKNVEVARALSDICLDGCYSANFNSDFRSECDSRYVQILNRYQSTITSIASGLRCTDTKSYFTETSATDPSAGSSKESSVSSLPSADTACQWIVRNTTDLTCGGGAKENNICGSGGRSICTGIVVCSSDFKVGNEKYGATSYSLSCLSQSGYCGRTSISDCFADVNAKTFTDETLMSEDVRDAASSLERRTSP